MTSLETAVRNQISECETEQAEVLKHVAAHGADAGFSGFIYYNETIEFATQNIDAIRDELKQDADDFGCCSIAEMVAGFRCMNDLTIDEINAVLFLHDTDSDAAAQVLNGLSWYALEKVAFCVEA